MTQQSLLDDILKTLAQANKNSKYIMFIMALFMKAKMKEYKHPSMGE